MPEAWAEETYTADYQLAVEAELEQTPGLLYGLVGTSNQYSDTRGQLLDRFDSVNLEEKNTRHAETNYGDIDVTRRYIKKPKSFNKAILIDRDDAKSTRVGLQSPVAMQQAAAVRRYHDDQWLTGYFGNAYEGVDGDTAVPFDSNNIIPAGGAGFTKTKLLDLREAMLLKDIDLSVEMPIVLIDPVSETELLSIEEYVNQDYNDGRPLARGEIKPWLGFRFIRANLASAGGYPRGSQLVVDSGDADTLYLPAFVPSGLARGVWTEFYGDIDVAKDKSHSVAIFAEACSAVVRTNEDKCFQLTVDHSP